MGEFIMAMGAEHTKPENLKKIIDTINAKIDMSDYMSACETLKHWIDKH